ncbi:MAG: hypothetical protein AAGA75_00415 [Cyanobacteria bacterium P01_E01_bin.6]
MNKNRPTFIAYSVKQLPNQKEIWREIGVAWKHQDRRGLTLKLDLMPMDGTIVIRQQNAAKPTVNPEGMKRVKALVADVAQRCTPKN